MIILLTMNWKLGLLTLLVLPALVGIRAIWLPHSKTTFRRARDASSIANGALAENINGIRTVQETRREAMNFELYEEKARDNMDAQVQSSFLAQIMTPTVDILTGLAMAVIIVVGGEQVLHNELQVGAMVAYVFYVQRFFDPVRMLSMQYTVMQRAMAAGHRIFEVLDVPVTIVDKPDAVTLDEAEPTVEFDHVTFGYDPARPVLHDINLKVKPRQVVALVGPTGSGKTSIMSLVRRFYEVDQGRVLVGGHDVRDVTLESLGRTIEHGARRSLSCSPARSSRTSATTSAWARPMSRSWRAAKAVRSARLHHASARGRLRHPAWPARPQRSRSASASCCPSPAPAGRRSADPDPRRGDRQHRQLHRA